MKKVCFANSVEVRLQIVERYKMYCKKCGNGIKDNAAFCPHCGGKIKKNEGILKSNRESNGLATSFLTEKEKERSQKKSFAGGLKKEDKKILIGAICGAVVLVSICFIWLLVGKVTEEKSDKKEYSIIGEWNSDDLSNFGSIMGEAVGGGMAGEAVEFLIGNALGEATVTFSETGQLYVSFYDVSISIGELTYEIIGSNRMRLAYEIEIPLLGNSVTASYNADYKIKKDTMTLDFFGQEITLDRVERD